jgi:acyl-CoA synthetase (AMP-forming)/AMP-acid ligase II
MDLPLLLRKSAAHFPGRPAVVYEGDTLSFTELYERSCRLANALAGLGLRPGDRVGVLGDNTITSIEEICGLALAGLVRVTLYSHNPPDLQVHALNLTGARGLIVQPSYLEGLTDRLADVPTLEHVVVQGPEAGGAVPLGRLQHEASADDPRVTIDPDAPFIIRFSAGTTGLPKGIVHTVRRWWQMGNELTLCLPPMDEDSRQLVSGPVTHANGLGVWLQIAAGGAQVVMPRFDPGQFLALTEQHRCTWTILVPTMIQMVVNHPDATKRDASSLQAVMYGGSPIAEDVLVRAQAYWGEIMYQFYGQSESMPATILPPRHHAADESGVRPKLRSAGRPTPNSHIRILDDQRRDLPAGEVGEIAIRSPGAMEGLWGDPEATAERLTADGYVLTRDLGYLDDDGFLFVADRKEDMIISGGYNIWPAEVENALFAHPAVAEAAVIGVPHDKFGETPKAFVVLRPDASATAEELIAWCREQIGPVKKPTALEFLTEPLPKSGVGKVLRRALKLREAERRAQEDANQVGAKEEQGR